MNAVSSLRLGIWGRVGKSCLSGNFCSSLSFFWVTKLVWYVIGTGTSKLLVRAKWRRWKQLSLTTHWRNSQCGDNTTVVSEDSFYTCQIKVCLLIAASLCYSFNYERVDAQMHGVLLWNWWQAGWELMCQGSREGQQVDIMWVIWYWLFSQDEKMDEVFFKRLEEVSWLQVLQHGSG